MHIRTLGIVLTSKVAKAEAPTPASADMSRSQVHQSFDVLIHCFCHLATDR